MLPHNIMFKIEATIKSTSSCVNLSRDNVWERKGLRGREMEGQTSDEDGREI